MKKSDSGSYGKERKKGRSKASEEERMRKERDKIT